MKAYKKVINGVEMKGWNDSSATWNIQSKDKDSSVRTEYYSQKKMTLSRAFEIHAAIYENF